MKLRVLTPLALVALAAAGCGAPASSTNDFKGDEKQVAQVVEDLQDAASQDEPKRVCDDILSPKLTQSLGDKCRDAVEAGFDDADTSELIVDSVRVTGTTARAQVFVGADEERKELMTFEKTGDDWKIASLGEEIPNDSDKKKD
jgi:hypothetical protein